MFRLSSQAIKNSLITLFVILASACSSTPELTAYTDKSTVEEYHSFVYTVVYQGYASKEELPLDDLNYGYRNYYLTHQLEHDITEVVGAEGTEYVTTWRAHMAVNEHGTRILPSIELNGLKTPTLEIEVTDSPDQDWAQWVVSGYKSELKVGEEVTLHHQLETTENAGTIFAIIPAIPVEEYEGINVNDDYICRSCNELQSTITISFDKPGTYSLSPIGWIFFVATETGVDTYGAEAPDLTFTVTE